MSPFSKNLSILIVANDELGKSSLIESIAKSDLSTETDFTTSGFDGLKKIEHSDFDCIIIGLNLDDYDSIELLKKIITKDVFAPILVATNHGEEKLAIEAVKIGASDYITPGLFNPEAISQCIRNVIRTNAAEKRQLFAEKILNEREELYKVLSENSKDLFCMHEPDGKYLYLSPALEDLLGYTPEELINTYPDELYHNSDKERVNAFIKNEINKSSINNIVEFRIRKKDGSYLWFETSIKPIKDESENIIQLQTTSRDITVRKLSDDQIQRAYEKISDLKNLLEGLLDSSLSGVMAFKSIRDEKNEVVDFEWLLINQSAEKILGKKNSDLKGRRLLEEMPKNREDGMFDLYLRVVETGDPMSHEHFYGHGNMKTWFQSVAVKLNDGFAVTITNITDRKKAEFLHFQAQFELEKQKEFFLQVINTSPNLIFVKDWNGRYTLANMATAELLGTTLEDVIDRTDADFNSNAEEVAADLAKDREVIKAGLPVKIEEQIRTSKGELRWYQIIKVPLKMTDDSVQALGIATDITDIKEAEKELLKAKETAEQSLVVKEQFLANMSHEIRTPMNAIIGFTDLFKKTPLNENQKQFVEAIAVSGDNLLTIINDILDFSKIESGKLEIETAPFSLKDVVYDSYNLMIQKAKEKNLQFNVNYGEEIPAVLMGDSARLNQILINLIGNAIKFTEQGNISVIVKAQGNISDRVKIEFTVKDSGIGIPKDKQEAVFERFTQASGETTRKFGGTGLGLSIVKSLVELQDGSIILDSEHGRGSTFIFYITYALAKDTDLIKEENIIPSYNRNIKANLLLAEDNLMNQKLAKNVLLDFGFNLDIVDNGKLAVEKFQTGNYDLILMDMQMPEMDGYEATKMIRTFNTTIPIIAMTAHAMNGEKEKCLKLGMNDYISKPFKADDLYNKIVNLVDNKQTITEPAKTETELAPELVQETSIIDLAYLKSLPGANDEFVKEMIEIFIEDTPKELEKITKAINDQDFAAVKRIAHKLKTSVSFMGLNQIVPLLKEMEAKGTAEQEMDAIIKLFSVVENTCSKAIKELITEHTH